MATGWNYVWGESWHEYIQRSTETRDEEQMHHESNRAMLGAISGQTASILTGLDRGFSTMGEGIGRGLGQLGDRLGSSMDKGFSQINSTMGQGFNTLATGMDRGFNQLGDTMNEGFSMLGGHMDMIAGEIAGLNASFQWGFGQMIAQLGGMNDSLEALIEIARTPVQTWAYNQFEIARENFRKGLYSNCLKRLDKAINGDNTSAGYEEEWRFHHMQGVVQLGFYGCDETLMDPAKAEQSFLLAARYAKADSPKDAARDYLSAGWSAFVQGKLSEALHHTQQAVALDGKLTEALFQEAKIQMANGRPEDALPVLRKAIDQSPGYVLKASADGDFKRHEDELNSFLGAMRQEQFKALEPEVSTQLAAAEEGARTISEVAGCEEILGRWRGLLTVTWGLLDLMKYARAGFARDRQVVAQAHRTGTERLAKGKAAREKAEREELERKKRTWHLKEAIVKVERECDEPCQVEEKYVAEEPYQVQEQYQEEDVVKPKGWFSKEQTELVTRTRTVTRTRKVEKKRLVTKIHRVKRQVDEDSPVLVNELGEVILFPYEHFRFVRIPAGKFEMGSHLDECDRSPVEILHDVTISRPFKMGIYPVTQALWQAVMGSNPSHFKGSDLPVECVSWVRAQVFITKLNELAGTTSFRLPTEAEWEYACKAGTTTPFWTGNNLSTDQANYIGFRPYAGGAVGEYRQKTTPVGMFQPNPWGLYDMHGNVCEWCQDSYNSYSGKAVTDPLAQDGDSLRVYRGGSWSSGAQCCRSAFRDYAGPDTTTAGLGFRLARSDLLYESV